MITWEFPPPGCRAATLNVVLDLTTTSKQQHHRQQQIKIGRKNNNANCGGLGAVDRTCDQAVRFQMSSYTVGLFVSTRITSHSVLVLFGGDSFLL